MSLAACAELVARGDPDRFLAAMTAPVAARERLLPLYAFNVEIARAPWVATEPMIGQMRLQFWRDALAEIADGKPARAHEIAAPLAEVIHAAGLQPDLLDAMVVARWADVAREPFAEAGALWDYLDATAGGLMWASVKALGGVDALQAPARAVGRAGGLANWLMAAPELEARGWAALPGGTRELVARAQAELARAKRTRFGAAVPALRTAWRATGVLTRAAGDPDAITEARLGGAEVARRGGRLLRSLRGRW